MHPIYRKQGLGKLLIEEIKKLAIQFKFQKLYLFTFDSVFHWYQKIGWEVIGNEKIFDQLVTVMKINLDT